MSHQVLLRRPWQVHYCAKTSHKIDPPFPPCNFRTSLCLNEKRRQKNFLRSGPSCFFSDANFLNHKWEMIMTFQSKCRNPNKRYIQVISKKHLGLVLKDRTQTIPRYYSSRTIRAFILYFILSLGSFKKQSISQLPITCLMRHPPATNGQPGYRRLLLMLKLTTHTTLKIKISQLKGKLIWTKPRFSDCSR